MGARFPVLDMFWCVGILREVSLQGELRDNWRRKYDKMSRRSEVGCIRRMDGIKSQQRSSGSKPMARPACDGVISSPSQARG